MSQIIPLFRPIVGMLAGIRYIIEGYTLDPVRGPLPNVRFTARTVQGHGWYAVMAPYWEANGIIATITPAIKGRATVEWTVNALCEAVLPAFPVEEERAALKARIDEGEANRFEAWHALPSNALECYFLGVVGEHVLRNDMTAMA